MLSAFFHVVFYNPIYNALVALVALVPGGDVGVAVILTTILIRLILLPFSLSAARAGRAMKALEPRLKELKEKHKDDKEAEALATWALYREARVNPFAGFLTVLVQLPVLLALYWVFRYEPFTMIDSARLYTFTPVPAHASMEFIGLLSVAGKSVLLAVLAGATQFLQAHFALSNATPAASGGQADFQKVMGTQMKYVFPVLIGVISYTTSGAVALYFITTNLAGALQEWHVRRKFALPADQSA
ncbi:MAG: membrane protein insertase YidC [Patescibacteria group bacterium]|nr:membrane protein insertase YidC [Patescibacteria group bacterium]MDE1944064.1 membrane protein insertase YidC [Patescibacteria group bacterium]MDE1944725.1 membrane protein insertase YidC [Patescibacteria group bacterium]MDE2057269.1 membrane protein insertase YidC [Patescibacteria group bacterium]